MSKLGYASKADFQAANFMTLASKYLDGGNHRETSADVSYILAMIIDGLSLAWDKAEDQNQVEE